MKKILLAVLLIATMTAFGAARQAQDEKRPMQMHMMNMMKDCPMYMEGVDIAVSDTPNGVAITFTAKNGNVEELRKHIREHVEMMKTMHESHHQ